MGLLTFATRLSFIYLLVRHDRCCMVHAGAARYVPAAVLSAIIVPNTITWQGAVNLSWRNPQILGGRGRNPSSHCASKTS